MTFDHTQGMMDSICPEGGSLNCALELAMKLSDKGNRASTSCLGPLAIAAAKKVINAAANGASQPFKVEREEYEGLIPTQDRREGILFLINLQLSMHFRGDQNHASREDEQQ
jgi:enoyl-CoA hydratase/carnithine racemase